MAEALALIGLASNIFGFIQLGIQLVAATQSLIDAREIPTVAELDNILDYIQIGHDRVRKHISSSKAELSKTDLNILKMVKQCDEITNQLRDLCKKLSTRPDPWSRTLDSLWVVVKARINRTEIQDLGERLMRMSTMIRDDQHSEIKQKLDRVNQAYREFDIKYDIRLNEIRDEVIAAIKSMSAPNAKVLGIHGNQLGILNSKLVGLKKELDVCDTQAEVIKSLYFKEIKQLTSIADTIRGGRHYETWDFAELESVFEQVISNTEIDTRFCFFIDGLDEYGGEDEEISRILRSIIESPHIKICASSRPRTVFEKDLWSDKYSLKMQELTKEDMRAYVRKTLADIACFKELSGPEDVAESMTKHIAEQARGVWLWVFLVSRDLKKAVNREEDLTNWKKIVNSLPQDLEKYFEQIISKIDKLYHDEMARIFLAALEGVQPLPLLAFSLLPAYRTVAAIF
ncbi:hypothetical protein SLS64_012930 [Diaporthe eres]